VSKPQSNDVTTTSAESAEPKIYTTAEHRAAIMERAGATSMADFHPAARPVPAASTPPPVAPPPDAATAVPAPPPIAPLAGPDVASELARMRAEVEKLQQLAAVPDEAPEEPPSAPAHPLEAHARQVLGAGAQPHHVARTVELLDAGLSWQRFMAHHEANPTPAGASEVVKAKRALDGIQREIASMGELASLHAKVAELTEQTTKVTPEQRHQQRSAVVNAALANGVAQHHPALHKAMQAKPAMVEAVKAYLLAIPDDESFLERGDAYLFSLDAAFATQESAPAAAPAAPPVPAAPPQRTPIHVQPAGHTSAFVTRRDFWAKVQNGYEARGRA
jgi:hypothetical protein